jgi:hypothetical protein
VLQTTFSRTLLLLCIGSSMACLALGIWYWLTSPFAVPEIATHVAVPPTISGLRDFLTRDIAFAATAAALGGALMGFTGFGGTLVMVPLVALVWGPTDAIAISMIVATFATAQLLPVITREADWPDVWPGMMGAVIGAPLGVLMLLSTDPALTRRLMGLIIILVAVIMMRGWLYRGPRNKGICGAFGSFGGFTSGYFGMGAPAVTLYYLSGQKQPAVQRANILLVLLVHIMVVVVVLALDGRIGFNTLLLSGALYLPYAGATWIGARVFRRASHEIYRRVCLWLLIVMGITVAAL